MKEEIKSKTLVIGNVGETTQFGIADNGGEAMILRMLRSKIYSNKILAFIREYSTNAYDAHILANKKETPIDVSLPSSNFLFFRVRDYGPGLSEEDIYKIYIKYTASLKRDSNEFNGQMGLGSKSAFAYTNAWNITSYHAGIKKNYVAYIDESDKGAVTLLSSSECEEEETGIEITIPIEPKDTSTVCTTASTFYYWFNGPVNIVKNKYGSKGPLLDKEYLKDDPVLFNNDRFMLLGTKSHLAPNSWFALMGGVLYPIDKANENLASCFEALKYTSSPYSGRTNVICFDVGEIAVSTSRESLEYTPKTIEAITKAISEFYPKLEEKVIADLDLSDKYGAWRSFIRTVKSMGLEINKISYFDYGRSIYNTTPILEKGSAYDFMYRQFTKEEVDFAIQIQKVNNNLKAKPVKTSTDGSIINLYYCALLVADEDKKIAVSKAKSYMKKATGSDNQFASVIILFGDHEKIKNKLDYLGIKTGFYQLTSSLPEAVGKENDEEEIDTSSVVHYKMDSEKKKSILFTPIKISDKCRVDYSAKSKNWDSYTYDSSVPTYYVKLKNFKLEELCDGVVTEHILSLNMNSAFDKLKTYGLFPSNSVLVGVRTKDLDAAKSLGCISFTAHLSEKLKEKRKEISSTLVCQSLSIENEILVSMLKSLGWHCPIKTEKDLTSEEKTARSEYENTLKNILVKSFVLNIDFENSKEISYLNSLAAEVQNRNPEFKVAYNNYFTSSEIKKIIMKNSLLEVQGKIPLFGQMPLF